LSSAGEKEEIIPLLKKYKIHGMMHITGGAFTKLKDILGNTDAHIEAPRSLKPQKIFKDLYEKGLSNKKMYSIFNCGIGFILSVPKQEVSKIRDHVKGADIIGEVVKGKGDIHITSAFDGVHIIL